MEMKDIFDLLNQFDASKAAKMELKMGDVSLKLAKPEAAPQIVSVGAPQSAMPVMPAVQTAAAPVANGPQAADEATSKMAIHAPLVGTFYAAPSPEAAPFVKPGQEVKKGQTVCLIEAMKMMNDVTAPFDCVIEEAAAKNGELVAFDAPLFWIREL